MVSFPQFQGQNSENLTEKKHDGLKGYFAEVVQNWWNIVKRCQKDK